MTAAAQSKAKAIVPVRVYGLWLLALSATMWSPIFATYAGGDGIPSYLLTTGRLSVAAIALSPWVWQHHRDDLRNLGRNDLLLALVTGVLLAAHFNLFFSGLDLTSVLIAVTLANLSPLFAALFEVLLGERLTRPLVIGLIGAVIGSVFIGLGGEGGPDGVQRPLLGSVILLFSAATFAGYIVMGRKLRGALPMAAYIWVVFGCAAVVSIGWLFITETQVLGHPPMGYFWVLMLALVPQLIGHSLLNYVVRFLPATLVSTGNELLPVLSGGVAFLLFDEVPTPLALLGSALVIVAVGIATLGTQR